jgi:hypothetical protein
VKFNHFIELEFMYLPLKLSILTILEAKYWSALFVLKNAINCYILRFHIFLSRL